MTSDAQFFQENDVISFTPTETEASKIGRIVSVNTRTDPTSYTIEAVGGVWHRGVTHVQMVEVEE